MDKPSYTSKEVAELLGVTTRSIRNYLKEGRLQGQKFAGKWHFSQEDIDNFIKQEHQENQNHHSYVDQEADYFSLTIEKFFDQASELRKYSQNVTNQVNYYLQTHPDSSLAYFMQAADDQRLQLDFTASLEELSVINRLIRQESSDSNEFI